MPRHRRLVTTATVLTLGTAAAAMGACGEEDPVADPPTASATLPDMTTPSDGTGSTPSSDLAALLADRTFLSDTVEGYELVPGARLVLRFDGDQPRRVGWVQPARRYLVDAMVTCCSCGEMMMTEMACEPVALMDQDAWVAEFLGADPVVVLDGPTLTLTGPTGSDHLHRPRGRRSGSGVGGHVVDAADPGDGGLGVVGAGWCAHPHARRRGRPAGRRHRLQPGLGPGRDRPEPRSSSDPS